MKLNQFRTLEGAANASFFSWVKFQYRLLFRIKWTDIADLLDDLVNSFKMLFILIMWLVVVVLSPLILPVLIPIKMRMAKKELADKKKKEEKPKHPYY